MTQEKKVVSVSLLTLLPHLPVFHTDPWTHEPDPIVAVSLHTRKGEKLLRFHTASGKTIFDFVPNNKQRLNAYMTSILVEEADRVGIPYRENPRYPSTTLDGRVEVEDESEATDKPIGVKPKSVKKEKRVGPVPFPVGSSLYQITKGKNKGKWTVWGMEGVQNSLKRFANIPFYVVKWEYTAITVANPEGIDHISLEAYTTKQEAEEHADWMKKQSFSGTIEVQEWVLTEDQIVR